MIGGLWLLAKLLSSPQGASFIGIALVAVLIVAAGVFGGRLFLRGMAARQLDHAVHRAVAQHEDALIRRRTQLVTPDAYGTAQTARWQKELEHFLATQVAPALGSDRQRARLRQRQNELVELISAHIAEAAKLSPAIALLPANMTGAEFEAFCAEKLRGAGWDAHVTKGARDQGVDVIATKNGVRIILQCKLYSKPVGNKAVQEAAAGRAHERAHYAAVVSATAYTRSAEQLAQTNRVLLLHHSQLGELDSMLATARPAPV